MIGRELTYETTPYPPDISIILKKGGGNMSNKLLTLDNLYEFFVQQNKNVNFTFH